MASRVDDKSKLQHLVQSLTSNLSPENEDKASLLAQLDGLNAKWKKLDEELRYMYVEYNVHVHAYVYCTYIAIVYSLEEHVHCT